MVRVKKRKFTHSTTFYRKIRNTRTANDLDSINTEVTINQPADTGRIQQKSLNCSEIISLFYT